MAKKPPIPGLQKFRELRKKHPNLETHEVWRLAGVKPTGVHPMWAGNGSSPKPAFYRADPRNKQRPGQPRDD